MPIDETGFFIFLVALAVFSSDANVSIGLDILYSHSRCPEDLPLTLVISLPFL